MKTTLSCMTGVLRTRILNLIVAFPAMPHESAEHRLVEDIFALHKRNQRQSAIV